MAFPDRRTGALERRTPILVTATGSVPIPAGARVLHAFIVGGGGSGGATARSGGAYGSAAGGAQGGSLYIRVGLDLYTGVPINDFPLRSSRPQVVSLTIGAGGTARTAGTGNAWLVGNTGGTTSISLEGGFSASVTGGGGGTATAGDSGGSAAGASPVTYTPNNWTPLDAVWVRPFSAVGMQNNSITSLSNAGGGGATTTSTPAEAGVTGASTASMSLPWWLRAVGITLGTGAAGAAISGSLLASGGGAGGFGGNGGAGAVSTTAAATASAGTGYGSGGGGAVGRDTFVHTSGAGAPGCAVIMFEVEV